MGSLKDMNVDYLSGGYSSPIGPPGQGAVSPNIEYIGFQELAMATEAYEYTFVGKASPVNQMLMSIAKELEKEAVQVSPYWLGGLREAHMVEWEHDHATLHLDKNAPEHPIMGGVPYDYGYKIHTKGGPGDKPSRMWFYYTWLYYGEAAAAKHTNLLIDKWASIFNGYNSMARGYGGGGFNPLMMGVVSADIDAGVGDSFAAGSSHVGESEYSGPGMVPKMDRWWD